MSLVSIILPVYNGEQYLAEAIESVLAQTYRPIEVIVVDDGSTDTSAHVAKSFASRVRYCFQKHSGAAAARNRGIALAHGEYLSFLDADDLWVKDKLTHQLMAFQHDTELDMVFGHVEHFFSPELDENAKARIRKPPEIMPGYSQVTILITKDKFLDVGWFNTNWQVGEFIDWYSRAVQKGLRSQMLAEVVTKRRIHTAHQNIINREAQTDYLRIIKASLDRRRKEIGH